jgi:hypothetical protein
MLRRLALATALSASFVVPFATSAPAGAATTTAGATSPVIGTFPIEETGVVDPGASAACGFTVSFSELGTGMFEVFFDQSGNPTRIQVEKNTTGTFSGNGLVVNQAEHTITVFDLTKGTEIDLGLVFRIFGSNGTLQMDVGRLVFDADGNVIFEAGPHPALHGDFSALCAALTP